MLSRPVEEQGERGEEEEEEEGPERGDAQKQRGRRMGVSQKRGRGTERLQL